MPTVYEARGEFQLGVETMRKAGLGALYEAFERLRNKLAAEGLFDEERKRELPEFPRTIGVVTSPAAAALRDVLTTLARRMASIPVVIYPAPVQGEGAGAKLAQAVRKGTHEDRVHEFGDVVAWVATLANQQGVDLSEAVQRYMEGCPRCERLPCGCP